MNDTGNNCINLLATLNSGYIYPFTVMLSSIMRSNPDESFTVYVAYSSLTQGDFMRIEAAVDMSRCKIAPILVRHELLDHAPVLKRISKETYYRLIAADYLPPQVKRIIYIDPDTVVINSLRDIYDMPMNGNLIIGSSHMKKLLRSLNVQRLHLPKDGDYINAGVLLMDIEGIRQYITSTQIFDYISQNVKKLYLADQDVLNVMFAGKIGLIDAKVFNLDEKTLFFAKSEIDIDWIEKSTVVVHFNGKYKPWKDGYRGRLKCFFDREAALTRHPAY